MKTIKRAVALVCSLAMILSMAICVNAAEVTTPVVTLSSTAADNTVTINFNTPETTITSGGAYVVIPTALKSYITNWEWSTNVTNLAITANSYDAAAGTGYVTSSKATYIGAAMATGSNGAQAVNGTYATLTISFNEIPATVAEADRTIVMGGEHAGMKKYACYVGTTYSYDPNVATKKPTNYWTIDTTAADYKVVVPAAEAEDEGPAYEGYVGDDDETDVAVGATFDFVPEETTTGIKWTVETNDGVKKSHVSAIDAAGAASYKLGLVIQGLAKSAVKSISAVLQ